MSAFFIVFIGAVAGAIVIALVGYRRAATGRHERERHDVQSKDTEELMQQ